MISFFKGSQQQKVKSMHQVKLGYNMMWFTIRKYDFISIKMNLENFTDYTSLLNVLFRG